MREGDARAKPGASGARSSGQDAAEAEVDNRQRAWAIVTTMARYAKDLMLHVLRCALPVLLMSCAEARAQLRMADAVDLALHNSGRVKSAENDVKRAAAALAVTKDIFIPSVVVGGGLGDAYGITITVPTIFTINTQSLVFSVQQRFYIRAAHADMDAARMLLTDARDQAVEDAVIGYVTVDHAQQTLAGVEAEYELAQRLVGIVEDRVNAHLDSAMELLKARRTAVQLKLEKIRAEDDLATQREGLAGLLGVAAERVVTDHASIPDAPKLPEADMEVRAAYADSPGIVAAEANAKAKRERAEGDSRYTWKPQITFAAQYGRISPIENVGEFYNLHGNYNTASAGIGIQFPLLDLVRKQAARASVEDAIKAERDVEGMRADQNAGRRKLRRGIEEQEAAAELSELELKIAQGELDATTTQTERSSGGPVLTPKDEVSARLQERQKYLAVLDAEFQLYKSDVYLLRQSGALLKWAGSLRGQRP